VLEKKKVVAKHSHALVTIADKTVTVLNLSNDEINPEIILRGVEIDKVYRNAVDKIPACDGCIFTIK
jgi:hypothetical protein